VVVYQQRRSSGSRSSAGGNAAELAADPASRWQAEPSFWVGGRPEALQWGPSSRLMASQGAAGVGICCRTLLKCRAADNVLAIQVRGCMGVWFLHQAGSAQVLVHEAHRTLTQLNLMVTSWCRCRRCLGSACTLAIPAGYCMH
jgi:hypothetical protein